MSLGSTADANRASAREPVDVGRPRYRRPTPRQIARTVLGLSIAVAFLAWALPHVAGTTWPEVIQALSDVGPLTAIALFGLMVAGLWMYTFTLTGSLPGLSHSRALILNVCGSSVGNLLPAGGAAGVAATYALCRSWGFQRRDISTSIVVTGVWNVLGRLALPIFAITALLLGDGTLPNAVVRGAQIGGLASAGLLAAFVAIIVSASAARAAGIGLNRAWAPVLRGRRADREIRLDQLMLDMRSRIRHVVGAHWRPLTFGLIGMFGVQFLLFWACLHAVGARPAVLYTFAAFALGRLLTTVGVTPGGIGITETGTVAVLVWWSVPPASATAGVVLFSVYIHLLQIPLGVLGWLIWRTSLQRPAR